jgi:uncharacterized membrane protein (UPF0182 family)
MNRSLSERVKKVAPYLAYDGDPYIVINDDGKLYWILDAYTYSSKYPYSQPFDDYGHNYIRNSVKISCDAYTGELHFYVADENDPIIKTYKQIFPQLYKSIAECRQTEISIRYRKICSAFRLFFPQFSYEFPGYSTTRSKGCSPETWKVRTTISPYYIIMRRPVMKKRKHSDMPFRPNGRNN